MSANEEGGRGEPSVSFIAREQNWPHIYRPRADLVTEDTQQKHTLSSHFTSLHPQLHHHHSSFTDHVTVLEADHKTKERRERSSPALILRGPQLVTCSPSLADVAPPENQETSTTRVWTRPSPTDEESLGAKSWRQGASHDAKRQRSSNKSKLNGS